MDAVTASSRHYDMQIKDCISIVDRTLYKFVSIIHGLDELVCLRNEKKVVTWLNNKDVEIEMNLYDEVTYHDFIFPYLHLSSTSSPKKIQNRKKIALQYAKIVKRYVPDERGSINLPFDYCQLVWVIKTVFKEHLAKNEFLLSKGIKIGFVNSSFYAKLEKKRIFIISGIATLICRGGVGFVFKVYELTTRKFLAFKVAHRNPESVQFIKKEIANLKAMHASAASNGFNPNGLQARPLATFDYNYEGSAFIGFIGKKYGVELFEWCNTEHSNEKRMRICKSLISAYKTKMQLGYWHGDIKLENILMTKEGVVLIDWAGSVLLKDAIEKFIMPQSFSRSYINKEEERHFLRLFKAQRLGFERCVKFIKLAQSMDLFALAVVLFKTLTSCSPFDLGEDKYPITKEGILSDSMEILTQRQYNENIVKTLIKMLADDPSDRYPPLDAIAVWEKLDSARTIVNNSI
jgi:hypothetical protein